MARPLQPSIQQEVQIARLTQLLQRPDLSDEVRAKMLFERGSYYDSVGLRNLARLDFNQSLSLEPAQPDIFNLLGVYFTQLGEFDAAYDAFESTLELDPANDYAVRNEAIALYYGGRYQLAQEEIRRYDQSNHDDPFSALWVYLIKYELNPEQARADLQQRYSDSGRTQEWGWSLVALMLNAESEDKVFSDILRGTSDNVVLAQRLTEAYFYLAKRYQMEGDYANAVSLYKLAISFNVYVYVEHRYAFLEMANIYQQVQSDKLPGTE